MMNEIISDERSNEQHVADFIRTATNIHHRTVANMLEHYKGSAAYWENQARISRDTVAELAMMAREIRTLTAWHSFSDSMRVRVLLDEIIAKAGL
jgi:hypothetical protein